MEFFRCMRNTGDTFGGTARCKKAFAVVCHRRPAHLRSGLRALQYTPSARRARRGAAAGTEMDDNVSPEALLTGHRKLRTPVQVVPFPGRKPVVPLEGANDEARGYRG